MKQTKGLLLFLFVLRNEVEVFLNIVDLVDTIILKLSGLIVPVLYSHDVCRVVFDTLLGHAAFHLLDIEEVFRMQR